MCACVHVYVLCVYVCVMYIDDQKGALLLLPSGTCIIYVTDNARARTNCMREMDSSEVPTN